MTDLSISGRVWRRRPVDERMSRHLCQHLGIGDDLASILVGRGHTVETAEDYLNPSLRAHLPDPLVLKDMEAAALRLARAIETSEQIAIFGDYDVDGATGTALLSRFIQMAGGKSRTHIPDRVKEGYGPNIPAIQRLQSEGATLLVTVDCGINAFDPLQAAQESRLDVIVLDHHQAGPSLPPAIAVVDPNRLDDVAELGQLAAVGVCFMAVVAVNRLLREQGYYQKNAIAEPDLRLLLDLVALGTVADMVPLTGVNRVLVAQGLKIAHQQHNIGLQALASVARIDSPLDTYHLGFLLGPRINAGGRVGDSSLGSDLLSTEDPARAVAIAQQLDSYNRARRDIEETHFNEALASISDQPNEPCLFILGQDWHPGVIGIVASRLVERFRRPCFVLALDQKAGLAKGSARSVVGTDIGNLVAAARQAGYLEAGGGHYMAAGFSLNSEQIEGFKEFLLARLTEKTGDSPASWTLDLDGILSPEGVSLDLTDELERLAPFGQGNSEPRFAIMRTRVSYARVVGSDHVSLSFGDEIGKKIGAIAFRCAGSALGQALLAAPGGEAVSLAGRIRRNSWQGRQRVQLQIDDVAAAGFSITEDAQG